MTGTIGFIGLGIMGLPMAANLVKKSGRVVYGFDVVQERCDLFQQAGGKAASKPEQIYAGCDVIFLCLPTNELVKDYLQAIIDFGREGTIVVDMGSTAPDIIIEMGEEGKRKGIELVDAPVSGGEGYAREGTLAIMCGGDEEVFAKVKPLLHCMGSSVVHVGKTGSGSVTKLINNMIVGANIAAVCEGLAFAVKAGLDPAVVYEAIKDGAASSTILDLKAPKIIKRDFRPSARMAVHQKDLRNAVALAEKLGVSIPMTEMVLGYMDEMERKGKIDEDHCAIAGVYEENMGVVIKSEKYS